MQVNVASTQLQPVPAIAVAVKPTGSVSVTVTRPEVDPAPALVTVSEYVAPTWPSENVPFATLTIVRSASDVVTGVVVVDVLLDVFVSPPPLMVARLTTLDGAFDPTVTVSVIGG